MRVIKGEKKNTGTTAFTTDSVPKSTNQGNTGKRLWLFS